MISDRDVWAAALLMVKRYGDDAICWRPLAAPMIYASVPIPSQDFGVYASPKHKQGGTAMINWIWAVPLMILGTVLAAAAAAALWSWFQDAYTAAAYVRWKRTGFWPWWALKADREAFESEERYYSRLQIR
jgi:hypothetical protein